MTLKKWSDVISENVEILKEELLQQRSATLKNIEDAVNKLKSPAAQGDRRENAAFSEAVAEASRENVAFSNIEKRLQVLSRIKDVKYKSIGMVVLYSTVRLVLIQDGGNREFIFKIFPEGISDLDKHILAKDSPVGRAIWLKECGETVTLNRKYTGEVLHYKIEEVY